MQKVGRGERRGVALIRAYSVVNQAVKMNRYTYSLILVFPPFTVGINS